MPRSTLVQASFCLVLALLASNPINAVEAILTDDTQVSSLRPGANYGGGRMLGLKKGQSVFLKFDLANLPAGTTSAHITRATLKLWVDRVVKPGSFDIGAVASNWSERTLTANNLPSGGENEVNGAVITHAHQKKFITFDLTALTRDWVDGVLPNHGISLVPTSSSAVFALIPSKEDLGTGHLPQLEISLATVTANPDSGPLDASSLLTGTVPNARLDAELRAIANLPSGADKLPYFADSGIAALTDFSATARSLLSNSDTAKMRETLALQERSGITPLVSRRLQSGANIRVMVLGDSIAPGMLYGDGVGALRILQNAIGNAGAGGVGVNSEQIQYFDGQAAYATENWFREYVRVPAGSAYEFSMSSPQRGRRWANTARVAWRAPANGTATFKIQTCSDADGPGAGAWVDLGAVRTAASSDAFEDVGSANISLPEGKHRLRVISLSGTVDVFSMELSHSGAGGCVILAHDQGSTLFSAWSSLSAKQRASFISAVDPDVIFIAYKDDAPTMTTGLPALGATLAATLSDGYPRDVVMLAPLPTVVGNGATSTPDGLMIYHQREAMRQWAGVNRAAFIDLWDLAPSADVYYDAGGVHLAGGAEHAHLGEVILDRLGWLRLPSLQTKSHAIARVADRTNASELPSDGVLIEDSNFRVRALSVGRWRLSGFLLFTNDGSAGEGARAQLDFSGAATLEAYRWDKFQSNAAPIRYVYPTHGASLSLPFTMEGLNLISANGGYGYEFMATIDVKGPGDVIVRLSKEAPGGPVYIREGSFLEARKL
jgi:hypothetical protein